MGQKNTHTHALITCVCIVCVWVLILFFCFNADACKKSWKHKLFDSFECCRVVDKAELSTVSPRTCIPVLSPFDISVFPSSFHSSPLSLSLRRSLCAPPHPSPPLCSIHLNEPSPTLPTHSSILYTCQSEAVPITSLPYQWLYHTAHANSVLHLNIK